MTEDSVAAIEAAPETVVTEAPEGTEGQVETPPAEGQPEEKSESAKRRERDKAHRARLQQDAAQANARAAEAEARKTAILEAGKKEAAPREADFPDPIEFAAAKAIWGAEQRLTEREARNAGEAAEAAKREAETISQRESAVIAEAWTAQVAEAKGKYADFDQVALANDLTVTKAMGELIMTSDAGPDVLYYLGQNRALAEKIAAMNPAEAARVIGRIEERVMSQAPKPRTETKAPAPINPVRGSAGASRNPENMSYVEWVKWRENGGKVT